MYLKIEEESRREGQNDVVYEGCCQPSLVKKKERGHKPGKAGGLTKLEKARKQVPT